MDSEQGDVGRLEHGSITYFPHPGHPENAESPMPVMLSGIVTEAKPMQFSTRLSLCMSRIRG